MTRRILFHSNQVSEQGTEVALFDYALSNETVLGNESVCLFPRDRVFSQAADARFNSRFEVRYYDHPAEWDDLIRAAGIDGFYSIRAGSKEPLPSRVPSFVHCVLDTRQVHGTVCAAVSPWLNQRFGSGLPVMPHIVERKSEATGDLRASLGISSQDVVFGCYGGSQSFNLRAARKAVVDVAKSCPELHFLFMNIPAFCDLPGVHFLPGSCDMDDKQRFINSCDAMLHARREGETFGLAVAEFFISHRPVISHVPLFDFRRRYGKGHLGCLGAAAITYRGRRDLVRQLRQFKNARVSEAEVRQQYLDRFSREKVMAIFDALFVSAL